MKSIRYRRKSEGRTNYNKRLKLLLSRDHRIVIRKSLSSMIIQIVDYAPDGDKIIASVHSRELKKYGLDYPKLNISVAYLTGLLCGIKAKKAGIKKGVIDLGLQKAHPKGKLMSAIKGIVDSGMEISANEEAFPDEKRISGSHIELFSSNEDNKQSFAKYKAMKIDVASYSELFAKVKDKILADNA